MDWHPDQWRKQRECAGDLVIKDNKKDSMLKLFSHTQKDLDLLHRQIHQEMQNGLLPELTALEERLTDSLSKRFSDTLRETIEQETAATKAVIAELDRGHKDDQCSMLDKFEKLQARFVRTSSSSTELNEQLCQLKNRADKLGLSSEELQRDLDRLRAKTDSFTDLTEQVEQSHDKIGKLTQCSEELHRSLDQLRDRTDKLGNGSEELRRGLERLRDTTKKLDTNVAESVDLANEKHDCLKRALEDMQQGHIDQLWRSIIDVKASCSEQSENLKTICLKQLLDAQSHMQESQRVAIGDLGGELSNAMDMLSKRLANLADDVDVRFDRLDTRASDLVDDTATRLNVMNTHVSKLVNDFTTLERLHQGVSRELPVLRDAICFVNSCSGRSLQWNPVIDIDSLKRENYYELESSIFSIAGLSGLRLLLRVTAPPAKNVHRPSDQHWICGCFLRREIASGEVSFRLSVNARVQNFSGMFADCREWGSPRMAMLDSASIEDVVVRLEILHAFAPLMRLPHDINMPPEFTTELRIADPAHEASSECARLSSRMVRKISWKLGNVTERLEVAAKRFDEHCDGEELEPWYSPPLTVAGLKEPIQLILYPLGANPRRQMSIWASSAKRIPRGTGKYLSCGFFVIFPGGTSVKCRVFIGGAEKTFEHNFLERGPYGFDSFCRLNDHVSDDGTVICGLELLEVTHEVITKVHGGAFGNAAEHLAITLNPDLGCMSATCELRDLQAQGNIAAKEHIGAACDFVNFPMAPSKRRLLLPGPTRVSRLAQPATLGLHTAAALDEHAEEVSNDMLASPIADVPEGPPTTASASPHRVVAPEPPVATAAGMVLQAAAAVLRSSSVTPLGRSDGPPPLAPRSWLASSASLPALPHAGSAARGAAIPPAVPVPSPLGPRRRVRLT